MVTTIPTIGFNVETVSPMPGVTFTVWDVGGQEKIRALWRHYFIGTEGKEIRKFVGKILTTFVVGVFYNS